MSKKNKNLGMPTDVAKAVWEEYANIIMEKFAGELAQAVAAGEWEAVRAVGKKMETFKFDFNRSNK